MPMSHFPHSKSWSSSLPLKQPTDDGSFSAMMKLSPGAERTQSTNFSGKRSGLAQMEKASRSIPMTISQSSETIQGEIKLAVRNRFRSLPDKDTFMPLLLGSAEVINRLPKIRKFVLNLESPYAWGGAMDYPFVSRIFELCYLRAGMPRSPPGQSQSCYPKVLWDSAYVQQNRVYWNVDRWSPWDDVQCAWRHFAGPDAKIVFPERGRWKGAGYKGEIYEGDF
ncbi:hypothetical protein BCR34DRAFT_202514 [Clohesyomyces aquaticus]|uniref:Uncharacterized protein n=1 Tax=Clohesyomyces aquaticus TaxID=1231657 RepID=A0A1Y1ZXF9_9PLEO|nr:hypothetical protein BCR34DRAFT_202514 [Clohesyomyces aquaticus]